MQGRDLIGWRSVDGRRTCAWLLRSELQLFILLAELLSVNLKLLSRITLGNDKSDRLRCRSPRLLLRRCLLLLFAHLQEVLPKHLALLSLLTRLLLEGGAEHKIVLACDHFFEHLLFF